MLDGLVSAIGGGGGTGKSMRRCADGPIRDRLRPETRFIGRGQDHYPPNVVESTRRAEISHSKGT